jgi:hypothetical protein
MGGEVAARQQAAVDGGVQGLYSPVQDFGETGDSGDAFNRQPRSGQCLLSAAG